MASTGQGAGKGKQPSRPVVNHHVDLSAQLLEAAALGKAKIVKRLLDSRVSVNCASQKNESPLLLAASLKDPEPRRTIANLLLERGCQINTADKDGQTPLISAIKNQDLELVSTLLRKGSDVKIADNEGNTPLCHAAQVGDPEIVRKVLGESLKQRMHVDQKNIKGLTPLLIAAQNSHIEAARVLVEKGKASVTIRDLENFMTPEDWMKETSCYGLGELSFLSPKTRRKRTRKEVKTLSDFINDSDDHFEFDTSSPSVFQFRVKPDKFHLPELNEQQSGRTGDWSGGKSMFDVPQTKPIKLPSFSHRKVVPLASQRGKLKLSFDKLPSLPNYSVSSSGNKSYKAARRQSGFYCEGSLEPLSSPTVKSILKRQDSITDEGPRSRKHSLPLPFLQSNDKKFPH
ncbi:PREDICTED: ankyrin repeat, SAM and basic leucine zipper domain-containing protein 1-like [Amphimedon queenslandica]|uniref:Uncharacterized protein n=1 Tax=Amphimedon queenslandica TaxID=400682 RepID=A0A1X7VTZ1_AMPQE|nr:PREDICTED: ankyrin repeat, SAM and basic leucine zipper domain-containing protein 1-like [Amphimedon queenslandica]|eukprot:XP_011404506.1 PREDICTED: ankyrin repeat, SAM and basic leucine zipper domain-containing protein 1-like [Amphimedon queenslandica]